MNQADVTIREKRPQVSTKNTPDSSITHHTEVVPSLFQKHGTQEELNKLHVHRGFTVTLLLQSM